MDENKLSPGDLATIIQSVENASVGMIVQCIRVEGEHSLYGTIWRVRSRGILVSEHGGISNEGDLPEKWLKKILPPPLTLPSKVRRKDLVE
jgi:hypothetical protein